MPAYEVLHAIPLTVSQKDELAQAISHHHATTLGAPEFFVYVLYTDVSQAYSYQAGKPFKSNRIVGTVRNGPSRTRAQFLSLCKAIMKSWDDIIGKSQSIGTAEDLYNGSVVPTEMSLHAMVLQTEIVAGIEGGFVVPPAGKDGEWLKENWEVFKRRVEAGDNEIKDMMDEVKSRGLV